MLIIVFLLLLFIAFVASVAAWANTKIIIEHLAEIKNSLELIKQGEDKGPEGK